MDSISQKILIRSIIVQIYCDVSVNKHGIKCGTSLRFSENKGWINKIDAQGWFQWNLDTDWVDDLQMMKEKLIDGKEL